MRHARNRSAVGRHAAVAIPLVAVLVAVAACGGTAAAPATPGPAVVAAATPLSATAPPAPLSATAPPATPSAVTPAPPTPAPGTAAAATTPAAVSPSVAPGEFESPAYGYTLDLPVGSEVTGVTPATVAWDGESAIGSNGPMVDQFQRSGQRLAFILAAPTGLDLDAWAAAVHARAVLEHGCAEAFTDERDVEIDGTPARVVAFACQGLVVYEATMVRDGTGVIAKQITPPPGNPDLAKKSLEDFMWFLEPLSWAK